MANYVRWRDVPISVANVFYSLSFTNSFQIVFSIKHCLSQLWTNVHVASELQCGLNEPLAAMFKNSRGIWETLALL